MCYCRRSKCRTNKYLIDGRKYRPDYVRDTDPRPNPKSSLTALRSNVRKVVISSFRNVRKDKATEMALAAKAAGTTIFMLD